MLFFKLKIDACIDKYDADLLLVLEYDDRYDWCVSALIRVMSVKVFIGITCRHRNVEENFGPLYAGKRVRILLFRNPT